jgi:hypothetical protein
MRRHEFRSTQSCVDVFTQKIARLRNDDDHAYRHKFYPPDYIRALDLACFNAR